LKYPTGRGLSAGRGLFPSAIVAPAYLLLTLLALWPIVGRFDDAIPSTMAFDPPLQAFLVGWDWHALTTAPGALFHLPIFHPEPLALTYMDSMLGETLLGAPVLASGASIAAAYNLVFILSFVLSAWATYRLARLFDVPRAPAFLAGLLFAFSPYRLANLDLLNQLQTELLPIGLFFAIRYIRRRRMRDAIGSLAALAAQAYLGWYYAFYLAIALVATIVYARLVRVGAVARAHAKPLALSALGLGLAVLPVALPYVTAHASMPEFRRTLGETALYSADVLDYFRTNASIPESLALPSGPQSYWPGIVAVALAVMGVIEIVRRRDRFTALLPVLAVMAWILSLGPIPHVAGHAFWVPLPYAALYFVPGFSSMRAPARLAVLVCLCASVLAGIGGGRLYDRLGRGRRAGTVFAALTALAVALAWYRPIPLLALPRSQTMPEIYARVAAAPDSFPLLEIPVPPDAPSETRKDALRQYMLLLHGKPRLDGTSGFVSPRYRAFRREIQSFPSDSALVAASSLGARLVLVHYDDLALAPRHALESRVASARRLLLVVRIGDDALYRLEP
jgi:hypothetical protein